LRQHLSLRYILHMIYPGHIQNGHIVLDDAVDLPEGARVEVVLISDMASETSTLLDRLKPIFEVHNSFPRDGAENLDHYLYGVDAS